MVRGLLWTPLSESPMSTVAPHIEITPDVCGGKPRVAGHRIKVQDIVIWTEQGQSPDDIIARITSLNLAEVHAALAYYYDHQAVIDQHIRDDAEFVESLIKKPT